MNTSTLDYLTKRVSKKEIIDKSLYSEGIFDILSFLFLNLWDFMKEENRFFGIVPVYQHRIQVEINKFNDTVIKGEKDYPKIEVYGKILYLFKPLLIKDYRRLCSKHLSKADSVIVIIHKITEILKATPWFKYQRELGKIHEIVEKLYNNIRNNAKQIDLLQLISSLNFYMTEGWVGKLPLNSFKINEEEILHEKKNLEGSGIRFEDTQNDKTVSEIVWKDE